MSSDIKQNYQFGEQTRDESDARVKTIQGELSVEQIFWNIPDKGVVVKEIYQTPQGTSETEARAFKIREETFEEFVRSASSDKQELICLANKNT